MHAFYEISFGTSTQADASAMPNWLQRTCQVLANVVAVSMKPPLTGAPSAEPHNPLPQPHNPLPQPRPHALPSSPFKPASPDTRARRPRQGPLPYHPWLTTSVGRPRALVHVQRAVNGPPDSANPIP